MSDEKKKTKWKYRWVRCLYIVGGQNRGDGEHRLKINKIIKIENELNKKRRRVSQINLTNTQKTILQNRFPFSSHGPQISIGPFVLKRPAQLDDKVTGCSGI